METYFDNVNETLLSLIRSTDRRVLEFGCGGGAFAEAVIRQSPDSVEYIGIELNPEAASRSRKVMSSCLERNIDDLHDWCADSELLDVAPLNSFDVVVMGDVLEHLINPLKCLLHARRLIHKDGHVIACIPNVQHWSVFVQLILGTWPRNDAGLFDRTHLRWFTLNDIIHLFDEANLTVESVNSRIFDEKIGQDIMEYLEPLANRLGVDVAELIARGLPLQYVLDGSHKQSALNNCGTRLNPCDWR